MAEINLEENILKLTLGDIVQSFTEEDLQKQMPIFMQDIDASTKGLIDTYQAYLSAGNFGDAESFRANNPALETRIWDAFKANSMLAYASYTYMYAKNQNQQCVFSDTAPNIRTNDDDLGCVDGDIWFKYSLNDSSEVDYTTPFDTYVLTNGAWQKFIITPKLDEVNSRIDELSEKVQQCFQYASDGKKSVTDAITGLGISVSADSTFDSIASTIESMNKGNFVKTINTLNGSVILPAGYYTGGTITLDLSKQTYKATLGSGATTTCEENGSITVPFGSVTNQTAQLLSVSGGLITALQNIPASSLTFTIREKRENGGNGNGASGTIKVYKNSTQISSNVIELHVYGQGSSNTITCNIPAMNIGDTIKVTAAHTNGYIDSSIQFTLSSATVELTF